MKFTNYYHNETYTTITDYYKGGTDRISDIRISQTVYNFRNEEPVFIATASLSGNCNGYGGLGFKRINSKECQSREEAIEDCMKKINNWLKKTEGFTAEIA